MNIHGEDFYYNLVHPVTKANIRVFKEIDIEGDFEEKIWYQVTHDTGGNPMTQEIVAANPDMYIYKDRMYFKKGAGGGSLSSGGKIPVDSRIVYVGDSITAHQFTVSGGQYFYMTSGYASWANILSGHKFYQPIGGNKGVAGERTDQIIARLGAILALRPKVTVMLLGTNDTSQSIPEATIKRNLNIIYKALRSIGSKVVAITIPDRFAPTALLSSANETIRQNVNSWILSNPDVISVDSSMLNDASYFSDGLHTNAAGAYLLGTAVAEKLNTLVEDTNVGYQIDPEAVNNYLLAGGTNNATSWSTQSGSAGGATVATSKVVEDGENKQLLTISGSYTGNLREAGLKQTYSNHTYFQSGDTVEGIIEFEVLEPLVNIKEFKLMLVIFSASWANILAGTNGLSGSVDQSLTIEPGRYVMKTPAIVVGDAAVPAITETTILAGFVDAAASQPVNAKIKIHRIGSRKVNSI